ncbi:LysR family transcriptional regulator [Sinorhizobium numidicum]|uniref:LysR family transcriptional regulator n=1 Tax=Sinorhizobium numidicum TaxID=680248 RepID=A0ABY8CW89_9HYPH|nr:LysR family transcriptional regulator [Sinorhizobium numidicum]WEX76231.1 LysR family transcriptional regulator [Sinorhizobium numidicum]WEX82890.1 LysR family transcriptional regulator [Sinorhizobium numidicum]
MNAESWGDLELLDHIVRGRTLSAAARSLGVDQTTAARRLAALERRIGAALFDRIGGRLAPTPILARVLDRLRTISEEAALSMAALRRATAELKGHVRVTSVGFVLARILAPALGGLERSHPGITLDLVADDQPLSFERRETDIAVRLGRTAEDSTRIKRLGDIRFRLCRPAGLPSGEHPVVRYGAALAHLPEMLALDRARPNARAALTADKLEILIEAALALGAEVMLPELSARRDPRYEVVDEPAGVADRPVYLMIHPERARVPSVAAVATFIEAAVRDWR